MIMIFRWSVLIAVLLAANLSLQFTVREVALTAAAGAHTLTDDKADPAKACSARALK